MSSRMAGPMRQVSSGNGATALPSIAMTAASRTLDSHLDVTRVVEIENPQPDIAAGRNRMRPLAECH